MPRLRAGRLTAAGSALGCAARGFGLEYFTIAWMAAEAGIAVTAGVVTSVALTGFGLDSVIEFSSAVIVIWQLRSEPPGRTGTPAQCG